MKHHVLRWAQLCVAAAGVIATSPVIASPESIVVKRGETVESISRKLGISKRALARANDISLDEDLRRGRRLVIPDSPRSVIRPATMRRAGVVEADRVTLRRGPDQDHEKITLLESGVRLIATRKAGDWYQVKTEDGEYGWIRDDMIRVGKELPTPKKVASKSVKKVVVTAAPADPPSPVVKMVKKRGAKAPRISSARPMPMYPKPLAPRKMTSLRISEGEYYVRLEQPAEFAPAQIAAIVADEPRAEVPDRRASRSHRLSRVGSGVSPVNRSGVIRTAYGYRGVPYRFGGTSRRGIDCSAFTGAVYRANGVSLPRTAREQFTRGQKIAFEEMQEGDLVFFHTTRPGISHVGIYIGSGNFVHASSSGGGVRVDSIMDGYYRKRFGGARRVKNSNSAQP